MSSYWEIAATATAAYAMPGQPPSVADFTSGGGDGIWPNASYDDGPHGFAFSFDGSGRILCPQVLPTGNAARTVFCRHNAANTGFLWGQSSDGIDTEAFRFRARNHDAAAGLVNGRRLEFQAAFIISDTLGTGWGSSAVVVPLDAEATSDVLVYGNGLLLGVNGERVRPTFNTAAANFSIGSDSRDLPSERLIGEVAEVMVFATPLSATDIQELESGPEPTLLSAGSVFLNESTLSWSGWTWDGHQNGLVVEAYDVVKDGVVVASGLTTTSIDLTPHGPGLYSVLSRASNDGGSSPQSEQLSANSISYAPAPTGRLRHDISDLHVPGFTIAGTRLTGEVRH